MTRITIGYMFIFIGFIGLIMSVIVGVMDYNFNPDLWEIVSLSVFLYLLGCFLAWDDDA